MSKDDPAFEPQLGRQRSRGGRRARGYLGRVLAGANLAGVGTRAGTTSFGGSRLGRGAGVGRILADRGRNTTRRVIVKARIVKLAGKGLAGARAHLRYLHRDGTTRAGERGNFYDRGSDGADRSAFQERATGDRHQFRFIVSPEDGAEYDDLKPLIRRLLARVEDDLGTELDWVAVDHFNTGHPHSHVVVRGKDAAGADLVLARDYLTHGIRERAVELVELDLGPRTARDIAVARDAEIGQERLTSLDRALLRAADPARVVVARGGNTIGQSQLAGRLAKLGTLGLAMPLGAARWQLAENLAATLTAMGERGDIIRTMQREFARVGAERAATDLSIYESTGNADQALVGRVVARGLADEHAGRHYLIVDAIDGRSHYVALGLADDTAQLSTGAIVAITPRTAELKPADLTIAAVAADNGGCYHIDAHLSHDPQASQGFVETHIRRLEGLRRGGLQVVRDAAGTWEIPADYAERVTALEKARLRDRPVAIETLSNLPLEQLVEAEAPTWLDRVALAHAPIAPRDAGFGREVGAAQRRRQQWLVTQGLADEVDGAIRYRVGTLATLQRRELLRIADELAGATGVRFAETGSGERVEGVLRRSVELASGRLAVIERTRDFTLVPWRPVLERHVGKSIAGIVRGDGIDWSLGRGRSGPVIE